ncbi:MAG: hypothetical protein QMD85_00920 [Candidatus Aenigmarchaeota archaeon]|nr:hypothetical protein [Candidatus Aenigmarchaeota archaeon]MDI6722101.1 hypothetical protein [Candidatus Aenigmarchaeota archaeon]
MAKEAFIITFHTTRRFDSDYERTKFFKELHGWKQIIPKEDKNYEYRRKGVLDDVSHMKIADSVFMIAAEHIRIMEEFFSQWEEKVEYEIMEIMINDRLVRRLHRARHV